MQPSPSAETCIPFFPSLRCSMFPSVVGSPVGCSKVDERYGPQVKTGRAITVLYSTNPEGIGTKVLRLACDQGIQNIREGRTMNPWASLYWQPRCSHIRRTMG